MTTYSNTPRGESIMEIVKGTVLLFIVLGCFTLFSYKAPKDMKAMSALASAAIATFLVEAFQRYVGGDLLHIEFLGEVGDAEGSMGGVAAASLVALAMGVSPVYALMLGVSCAGLGLLPEIGRASCRDRGKYG